MTLSSQEREDAETIGFLKAENAQNRSNIDTLFTKLDELAKQMHELSTKVQVMIMVASVLSPIIFAIINHYLFK